jgi:CRISPR-associated protein Cas5d
VALHLRLEGERALFARPEIRRDLVSYDLLTPHAARGVLDSIYWRPGMTWVIDRITILQPIRRELCQQDSLRMILLRDVAYIISAHFEMMPGTSEGDAARHAAMSKRAAGAARTTYLGRVDFGGSVSVIDPLRLDDGIPNSSGVTDHGWLLHGIAFESDRRPRFFRAEAVNGTVDVPHAESLLVFS